MLYRLFLWALVGGLVCPAWADEPGATELERRELLQRDVPIAGGQARAHVVRVKLPVGFKTPLHTHEGPGPRYVLRGRIKIEEGGQSHVYGVGEAFWETGQWMTAENVGDSEVELLIVEITATKPQ